MSYWKNKVVIVTGGSDGLGLAIAKQLAQQGARLFLAARGAEVLQAKADALAAEHHTDVTAVATDVTDDDQVKRLIDKAVYEGGGLDALFNCVGRSTRGDMKSTSVGDFAAALELNFLSLVRCTHTALPHLLKSRGHVINIGSLASKSAAAYLGSYPSSKFAVAAYSQQLRLELEPEGLHVLLVCPGPISRDDAGQRYVEQAADLPNKASQPGGGVKIRGIDPRLLAERILIAAEKRKPELIVPARGRILFAISQFSPRLGDWIVRRMT